jgi:hypothetical protein
MGNCWIFSPSLFVTIALPIKVMLYPSPERCLNVVGGN